MLQLPPWQSLHLSIHTSYSTYLLPHLTIVHTSSLIIHTSSYLQALVDVGFRLSTGSIEALRPAGVKLLREVVVTYASLEDPLMPGVNEDPPKCGCLKTFWGCFLLGGG